MTLEAIKEAIEKLPPEQQTVLAVWLSEREWQSWDEQIEPSHTRASRRFHSYRRRQKSPGLRQGL
jgi:hypothetical protein